jgi:hypothetical protein
MMDLDRKFQLSILMLNYVRIQLNFRIVKANRFYDENDLVVIAKKRNNLSKPKLKFDSQKKVISFLKNWLKFSILLKKNTNNYKT